MNNHTDTRWTDYALDELDDAQRRELEQLLATDAEARRAIDDTAALATMLRTATMTGIDGLTEPDESLRAKLVQRTAVASVAIVDTTEARVPRVKRTTLWAVAASIAVLLTSVGTIAMMKGSADRKASPMALQVEADGNRYPGHFFDSYADHALVVQSPSPASKSVEAGEAINTPNSRMGRDQNGAVGLDLSGEPLYLSFGTADGTANEKAPIAPGSMPAPNLPQATTPSREGVRVQSQPLFSEIPQVNTFNYAAGAGGQKQNAYTGGTAITAGATTPGLAAQQPNAPAIHNPTPMVGKPMSDAAPTWELRGANTYSGTTSALGDLATDTRARPEEESEFRKLSEVDRLDALRRQNGEFNTEAYDSIVENPFLKTTDAPLSTFSIDVDTASYSNVRRFLNDGQRPPASAVRLEEFINYFTYDYPQPTGDDPFAVTTEAAHCPWNGEHVLVRVGLKGKEIHRKERPATNLVFLVDVSGSMNTPNKLPLVRESLKLLVNELGDSDRVAMVVYAGSSGLVLPSTGGDRKQTILEAIGRLEAGGSTNGASGITLAYQVAADNFIKGGVNRVVLATDGDFNVGVTNQGDLVKLIETKAKTGVFFSALGYGMGNLKDSTLEKLADKGNGNYAYIDTLAEARKVLVEQMSGTLVTIAKDVKIQIEFNPQRVAAYRLLGYENRILAAQDFNDDKKDAGEIGAGHTVTALYELVPTGSAGAKETKKLPTVDPLKYQQPKEKNELTDAAKAPELLTLKLRYKQPDGDKSKLLEQPLTDDVRSYGQASGDFKFAASVAAFGMLLRDSKYHGSATFDAVLELAHEGIGKDQGGYRAEFVELVRKAKALLPRK